MLRVFVALGKQTPKCKAILEDTQDVARVLAKYNCTLVQGGAKVGLMGAVVKEFQSYSDEVVMIVPEAYKADLKNTKSKEQYVVESESDRLKMTIKSCDMMIVLPGGSGTLAELAFYNETCKSGEHNARIVVVNTKGYYNPLFKFLKHQIKNGMLTEAGCKFDVVKNVKGVELIIQQLIANKQAKLHQAEIEAIAKSAEEKAKKETVKTTTKKEETKKQSVKKAPAKKVVAKTENKEVKAEVKEQKSVKGETKKASVKAKEVKKPEVKNNKTVSNSKKADKKVEVAEKKETVKKAPAKKEVVKTEKKDVKAKAETKTPAKKTTKKASK